MELVETIFSIFTFGIFDFSIFETEPTSKVMFILFVFYFSWQFIAMLIWATYGGLMNYVRARL